MRVHSLSFFFLSLIFVVNFCKADEQTFEVVGTGECADCKENNFKNIDAFSGLHVTIDCKLKTGDTKRVGYGELDQQGQFKISLPTEIVRTGQNLKEECYAQLHSAAAIPCPAHNGLENAKIIFKSQNNQKFTFAPTKNLKFSSALCTSKFLWPYFKYPPLPKTDSIWKKKFHKFDFPFPPVYKPPAVKPVPPAVPIYKPKPVYKSPVVKPVYKPKPKPLVYKPKPKPPVVVKPVSPPVPVYYKPPVVTKPLLPPPIPLYPLPPFKKKPCPPLPKLPPFPKIPPKYYEHPKFGYFPPLPPSIPHT